MAALLYAKDWKTPGRTEEGLLWGVGEERIEGAVQGTLTSMLGFHVGLVGGEAIKEDVLTYL